MTVTDGPTEEKLYTAAELLEMVLAAYERGLTDRRLMDTRDRWLDPQLASPLRDARRETEIRDMRLRAATRYQSYGYSPNYDYRGGTVDWDSGLPAGSGCAWLRRKHQQSYEVAA